MINILLKNDSFYIFWSVILRIISGSCRGLRLVMPKTTSTRPTRDEVREAIFNIIQTHPLGAVLDLFAGSGAFGVEALSRGAASAAFVDKNGLAIAAIKENLAFTRLAKFSAVKKCDALRYLETTDEKFDTIFLDPPYNIGLLNKAVAIICKRKILSDDGLIVAETETNGEFLENEALFCQKTAKYGRTLISIYNYI
jgi:16S rRNA (guanine(966)-N(2))-methyltransferase RsmD